MSVLVAPVCPGRSYGILGAIQHRDFVWPSAAAGKSRVRDHVSTFYCADNGRPGIEPVELAGVVVQIVVVQLMAETGAPAL